MNTKKGASQERKESSKNAVGGLFPGAFKDAQARKMANVGIKSKQEQELLNEAKMRGLVGKFKKMGKDSLNAMLKQELTLGTDDLESNESYSDATKSKPLDFDKIIALIRAGANPDTQAGGLSALHHAAMRGYGDVVGQLIEAKSHLNIKGVSDWTPLYHAVEAGHGDVVDRLIGAGASVDLCNNTGRTPLHRAILSGHGEIVDKLIKAKASVDKPEQNGQTPLHYAAGCEREDLVRKLIDAGAHTMVRDNRGKFPSDLTENGKIQQLITRYWG